MPSICQMVINLINAMDDANIGATQAAPGGKTFAPAEPVDDLSVHIDEVSMSPLYCNRPPCTGWLLSARLLARCTLLCGACTIFVALPVHSVFCAFGSSGA